MLHNSFFFFYCLAFLYTAHHTLSFYAEQALYFFLTQITFLFFLLAFSQEVQEQNKMWRGQRCEHEKKKRNSLFQNALD